MFSSASEIVSLTGLVFNERQKCGSVFYKVLIIDLAQTLPKKELKESKPRIIAAYVLVQLLAKSLSNV